MIQETITAEKVFEGVSDSELHKQYIETGTYKTGYCYNPELRYEVKRRRKERIRNDLVENLVELIIDKWNELEF